MNELPLKKGQPDFLILIISFLLLGIGLVMVYSSSQVFAYMEFGDSGHYLKRQLFNASISVVAMFFFMFFPYQYYKKLVPIILLFILGLMILVFTPLGIEEKGARRWVWLGFTSLQPSEFVKLGLVIYLASIYSKKQSYINDFVRGVVPPLVIVALFFILIIIQRDLGTAIVVVLFTMVMIFCSGARMIHMIGLGIVSLAVVVFFIATQGYRLERVLTFRDPWADPLGSGYQLIQSLYAIGHGGISGNGLGYSIQKFLYLPEAHTDFIFSITAEELGLVGVSIIFLLFLLLIIRGIIISVKCQDVFGTLLGIGIVSMIGIQTLINVAVVSGTIPITGIALPFISYGGTSLLITMSSVGILLNISRYLR